MSGLQISGSISQQGTEPVEGAPPTGSFVNREVASHEAKPTLRRLESAPLLKKSLKDRNIALIPEKEARGVLPEYQKGRLMPAPKAQDVELGQKIASGGFGTVYRAKPLPQETLSDTPTTLQKGYVVKRQKDAMNNNFASAELEVALQNRNTHAPKIVDSKVIHHLEAWHTSVIEQKMMSLKPLLKSQSLELPMVRNMGRQILQQIQENHENNIIHRDIKPDNILMDHRGQVYLTDYGIAEQLSPGQKLRDISGTTNYISPEAYSNNGHDMKSDIWAMGLVMYELLTGHHPDLEPIVKKGHVFFNHKKYNQLMTSMAKNNTLPPEAKSLLKTMLNTDPYPRPNIQEVLDHLFFHPPELSYAELQSEHIHLFEKLAHYEQQIANTKEQSGSREISLLNHKISQIQLKIKTIQEKMKQMDSVSDFKEQQAYKRIKKS